MKEEQLFKIDNLEIIIAILFISISIMILGFWMQDHVDNEEIHLCNRTNSNIELNIEADGLTLKGFSKK